MDSLCDQYCSGLWCIGQQNTKLFSPVAGNTIRMAIGDLSKGNRYLFERLIAHQMAISVVVIFEIIDITQNDA
ncbi:Uncharacterised protein [Vibrio cholerae]|nr:Uncharacterised protein [Vibrio cholerae]